jgi:predicted lipid-binding transport protein (Tim44 family)
MSNNFGYIDIILLAMIAGFIILRLRNILGRRTGNENKQFSGFNHKKFEDIKQEIIKPKKTKDDDLSEEETETFLKGAAIAYENIITSFAKGDQKQLKELLTPEMQLNFEQAILERNKNNIQSDLTFIGMRHSKLEKYEIIKDNFYATVKFVCEIISTKTDKDKKIISGDPDKIKTVTDHWKFSKKVLSNEPNWYLSEIISK